MTADTAFFNRGDTDYHKQRQKFAIRLYDEGDMLPHRYVLVLTNKCNLRCTFCFQQKKTIPGAMTAEDWIRLIDQLPSYAWVTITGGEPLLFSDFERVFRYIATRFKCNLISNGLLLDEKLVDMLLSFENFRTLSISVDAIGNQVRGIDPKKWSRTERMMRYFRDHADQHSNPALLDAKTVVLDSNADQLLAIHRYCMEDLRCNTHSFQLLKGSPLQHADIMSPLAAIFDVSRAPAYERWTKICEQLEQIRQYGHETGRPCYLHPKLLDLNGDAPIEAAHLQYINVENFEPSRYLPCKAMWESVHVNVDGEVFPCMAVSFGNIKTHTLSEVVQSPVALALKATLKGRGLVEGCNRCGYLQPRAERR